MNGVNRFRVLAIAALLGLAVLAPAAPGAPIVVNLVTADYGTIMPSPPQDMLTEFTMTLGVGTFTGNNGMLGALMVDTLDVNLIHATITLPPPPFMVTGNVPINAPNSTLTFSDGTHQATFVISGAMIMADFNPNGVATIEGQAALMTNTFDPTVIDLSAFKTPGGSDFKAVFHGLMFTGTPGNPAIVAWSGPVAAAVTITPKAQVPEPASLLTWVVMGLAGLKALRRRAARLSSRR
jgi:hypothetical protein